jgi:hypothetical protein
MIVLFWSRDEGSAQGLPWRKPGSFGWGIRLQFSIGPEGKGIETFIDNIVSTLNNRVQHWP